MAILSIVTYPQKILKRRADRIDPGQEVEKLVPQMIKTMYHNLGIGLAAPQVGISKRIIIVETSEDPRATVKQEGDRQRPLDRKKGKPLAFVNPVIVQKSKRRTVAEEGCLSLPGIFVQLKRAETIELVCQTPEGEKVKIKAGGLIARIFQHEIDHLNGKLIIDHMSPFKRLTLRTQLKELVKSK